MGYVNRISPENHQPNAVHSELDPFINFDLARERRDGSGAVVSNRRTANRDQDVAINYGFPDVAVGNGNNRSLRSGEFKVASQSDNDLLSKFQPPPEEAPSAKRPADKPPPTQRPSEVPLPEEATPKALPAPKGPPKRLPPATAPLESPPAAIGPADKPPSPEPTLPPATAPLEPPLPPATRPADKRPPANLPADKRSPPEPPLPWATSPTDKRLPAKPTPEALPLEKGIPHETRMGRTRVIPVQDRGSEGAGQLYGLRDMENHSGPHSKFDALVYVPNGFDPKKPVNLVVHAHGMGRDTLDSWNYYDLGKQMRGLDSQTLVVTPAWQVRDGLIGKGNGSGDQGELDKPGAYAKMLQETFNKTPGVQGLQLQDVDQMTVIAHSGGGIPAASLVGQMGSRITTLAMLDSLDSPTIDAWVAKNRDALQRGDKQYFDVYHSYRSDHLDQLRQVWGMSNKKAGQEVRGFMAVGPSQEDVSLSQLNNSVVYIDSPSSHYEIPKLYFGKVITRSNELKRP
jgi:hypothetical protein